MAVSTLDAVGLRALLDNRLRPTEEPLSSELRDGNFGPLSGGLVLREGSDLLVRPTCCSDLGNQNDWRNAASHRGESWSMLWIGHPWLSVRFSSGLLELSGLHEGEPPEPAFALASEQLSAAVSAMQSELEQLASRLQPLIAMHFENRESAVIASRVLAGLA